MPGILLGETHADEYTTTSTYVARYGVRAQKYLRNFRANAMVSIRSFGCRENGFGMLREARRPGANGALQEGATVVYLRFVTDENAGRKNERKENF